MLTEVMMQIPSLGIAGLLFVMWWTERQDRVRSAGGLEEALRYAGQVAEINRKLLDIVQANTEALTALREELRSQRAAQGAMLTRLIQQLEEISEEG